MNILKVHSEDRVLTFFLDGPATGGLKVMPFTL